MTHPNKAKGNTYERELRALFRSHGMISERAWGSDGRSMGLKKDVDLTCGKWKIQAKRIKKLPDRFRLTDVDAVVFREDRGESYILLRLDRWIEGEKQ